MASKSTASDRIHWQPQAQAEAEPEEAAWAHAITERQWPVAVAAVDSGPGSPYLATEPEGRGRLELASENELRVDSAASA